MRMHPAASPRHPNPVGHAGRARVVAIVAMIIGFAAACGPAAVTSGTDRSTQMDTSSPVVAEADHGTRIYCPVSHFNHDDPVVFPGEPGAAHLHMYWGNTETNASSTGPSLLNSGNSTCEGGTNNRSAYWMPALFNADDEVVLPESLISYYKSFGSSANFDRSTISRMPNGLEMLANQNVKNSGPWNFTSQFSGPAGDRQLQVRILFPVCLATNAAGQPRTSSANNTSHLSYASGTAGTANDCPVSHPYRIPQLSYNVFFDVDEGSDWYFSSDSSAATQGQSLHADYIAAWDTTSMNRLVQCNRQMRKECQFVGSQNGQTQFRNQLPERFLAPDGTRRYQDSIRLRADADRTPYGHTLTANAG